MFKVKVLQVFELLFCQAPGGLGGGVGGLVLQKAVHVSKHGVQQSVDLVHHLPDHPPGLGVHLRFCRLLAHEIPKAVRRAEHGLHGIGGELFQRLVPGHLHAAVLIPVQIAFHQLLGALHAVLLHKIGQQPVHHGLTSLRAPLVQHVEGLVHHGLAARLTGKVHFARRSLDKAPGVVL